ncbi:MAG: DUF6440 family protein [Defluviitaleaceae bacterium]|nr:DUF6440 family protein [Defluviitaleaceae bacterium]
MSNNFEVISGWEKIMPSTEIAIVRDKDTGVHYVLTYGSTIGAIAVRVDKDGKPIVT